MRSGPLKKIHTLPSYASFGVQIRNSNHDRHSPRLITNRRSPKEVLDKAQEKIAGIMKR